MPLFTPIGTTPGTAAPGEGLVAEVARAQAVEATKAGLVIRTGTKNLFNTNDIANIDKHIISTAGVVSNDSLFFVTHFIEVEPSTIYTAWDGSNRPRRAVYYDTARTVIGFTDNGLSTFTTPANIKYVRFAHVTTGRASLQVEKGSSATAWSEGPSTRLDPISNVTPEATNFLSATKNLLDTSKGAQGNIVEGKYYSSTNETIGLDALLCYGRKLIKVTPGYTYTGKAGGASTGTGSMRYVAYYDINRAFVAQANPAASIVSFTVPAGVEYVRITTYLATLDNFQLEQNTVDTNREPFGYNLNSQVIVPIANLQRRAQVPVWGMERLRLWLTWLITRDTPFDIMIRGDSYVDGNYFASRLYDLLQSYGLPYGGPGFLSFNVTVTPTNTLIPSQSIYPDKFSASWAQTDWDGSNGAGFIGNSYSPGAVDIKSLTNTATVNVTVNESLSTVTLIYKKQSGGGSFQYRVNSGSWVTVSTANATTAVATEVINTSAAGSAFTITIQALATGISLGGMVGRKGGNTLTVHKCGLSGSTASKFGQTPLYQDAIAVINPKLTINLWATNEQANNINPSTMKANIQTLTNFDRNLVPLCDQVFVCPPETKYNAKDPRTYLSQDYLDRHYELALDNSGAFIGLPMIFGTFGQPLVDAAFIDVDEVHPGSRGRTTISGAIFRALTQ
jgi:hypothetical protein